MDYKALCQQILDLVGGQDNVGSFTNCMTRLRLNLVDPSQARITDLKALNGVLGVVPGDQTMIILGPGHAQSAREAMEEITGRKADEVIDETNVDDLAKVTHAAVNAKQNRTWQRLLKQIGNIFIPMIPAFIGCGLINGIVNIIKNADPTLISRSPWFYVLSVTGGLIFTYVQFATGYNASKEFGGTPILGFVVAGLMYDTSLLGIPAASSATKHLIPLVAPLLHTTFTPGLGGLIGVIMACWLFAFIEKQLRKIIPASLSLFIIPIVTIIIGGFITIIVLQPIAGFLMTWITKGLMWLLTRGGVVGGYAMSAAYLPMVMLGIHRGLTPIQLQLIAQYGYTSLLPVLAMAGAGQVGMAIAIYVKTKSKKLRRTIAQALPIGILGVGEPLIYGVSLPLFYPFITACLGGGFGGAVLAIFNSTGHIIGSVGPSTSGLVLTMLIAHNMWWAYLLGVLAAYIGGFVLTYLFGYNDKMLNRIEAIS